MDDILTRFADEADPSFLDDGTVSLPPTLPADCKIFSTHDYNTTEI